MEKSIYLVIALLALIFIGFIHSRTYEPNSTTKSVVLVREQPSYNTRYDYKSHYNPYKSQYYN